MSLATQMLPTLFCLYIIPKPLRGTPESEECIGLTLTDDAEIVDGKDILALRGVANRGKRALGAAASLTLVYKGYNSDLPRHFFDDKWYRWLKSAVECGYLGTSS